MKPISNVKKITKAIEKFSTNYPTAIIWGVKIYPTTLDSPFEEIAIFGGCSEETWRKALEGNENFYKTCYRLQDI